MENNNVQNLLGVSMEKIKEMTDANTVIGNPVTTPDGTVLIPVSGGSDLPSKTGSGLFGGGSGAGINITPVAFLVIANGDVRLLSVSAKPDTTDKLVNLVPDVVDKISGAFSKKKEKSTETTVKTESGSVTVATEEVKE